MLGLIPLSLTSVTLTVVDLPAVSLHSHICASYRYGNVAFNTSTYLRSLAVACSPTPTPPLPHTHFILLRSTLQDTHVINIPRCDNTHRIVFPASNSLGFVVCSLLAATILTSTQQSTLSAPASGICLPLPRPLSHTSPLSASVHNNNNDDNNVEEEIEEMIIDEKNTSLAQVEEEDVDTMSIDSTLASDAIPTKKDLKGASRTTGGIFRGKAQGNNFWFADNMNESSSMVVNPQGLIMNFDTEQDTWIIFGHFNDIESTDTIQWTSQINDLVLYLAAISVKETVNFHLARSVGSSYGASTTTKSSENASASAATDENLDIPDGLTKKQELIISVYKVDKSLLGHKNWSIQMAWKIYQEPIMRDLHTMFGAAGTAWHHWDKVLKFVSNYPDMEEWLSTATPPDNKATHELWGLEKTAGFTRTDLENWIKKKKGISAGKGKQKAEGGKGKKGSSIKNK
ncbi:hypothetical protein BDQ17DRAFT_1431880 [Cyathus striatus]|nr:hypothetical protein BDQ17DRAFT_1431880 [Cyathus striatus]